ncbi:MULTISPECIES: CPBP family intramembrane glutamic endopeptidase [unclassified Amycolatopsis]|uniref:CPBP family intramembrane glutamic endopeptidase n=1 Tax=unclassified Amycolatopsis TaxID=2618356 RepID=UPI001FF2AA27|nr:MULTISPECIES: CPBP family intramembrane glutamic endopeptidase [unclassified Amycolatopsis]UOZ05741.1 CPBP family intramembrane metalloprotease [Amycolatopsis sp. WQ 127309]WSK75285.1 CPBP family intramembrane metalloprotease [Amycolatopsis sp. NBC_01286]
MKRRFLTAVTAAGTGLLGASLSSPPGSLRFYGLTAGVATTWLAGARAAGPVRRGRRDVVQPVLAGAGAFGVFYGCALVSRHIPPLRRAIAGVLDYAHRGSTTSVVATTLLTGAAEEVFFRGALYDAAGARRSTAIYVLSTCATRNPALVLASAVMGSLFAWQRHRGDGVQAPVLTHVVWSALMLAVMPRLFGSPSEIVRNEPEVV